MSHHNYNNKISQSSFERERYVALFMQYLTLMNIELF